MTNAARAECSAQGVLQTHSSRTDAVAAKLVLRLPHFLERNDTALHMAEAVWRSNLGSATATDPSEHRQHDRNGLSCGLSGEPGGERHAGFALAPIHGAVGFGAAGNSFMR